MVVVVGSGASGVHFALTILQKGYDVTMLDVGNESPPVLNPEDKFCDLKNNLADPVQYFLGDDFRSVIFPDSEEEYYGFPPGKGYVFLRPEGFKLKTNGFSPLVSFARGGLAEAWTGGTYPFNDDDLKGFPFTYRDIEPYYSEVARRIGINGIKDDLAGLYPLHDNLLEPLSLDRHSECLLSAYGRQRAYLNRQGVYMGRARVATLTVDRDGRGACAYDGRCIWGCPTGALYTPSITLNECMRYRNFRYISGVYVTHFKFDNKNRVTHVVARSLKDRRVYEYKVDRLVLAAGTLSSSMIFMNSIYIATGEVVRLHGLMDNRQVLIPFVNLRMAGTGYDPETYQYHQLVMAIASDSSERHVHCQITTLKTAMTHPIIQSLPFDLNTSLFMFRNIHSALGLINLNFYDLRREENYLTLEVNMGGEPTLVIDYTPAHDFELLKNAINKVKAVLRRLGCIAPGRMTHIRPMGAGVHYAGTLPMSLKKKRFTTTPLCQSNEFHNLYIVDGSTFPYLPAKNITFTLMANAVRVADKAF